MKKFQFTLQRLKDFRAQELDRQKNALAVLQGDLKRLEESLDELNVSIRERSDELTQVCMQGARVTDIAVRKRYIVTLQQEIHICEQQIIQKKAEVEKQLSVVVDATKDVKTLEMLEEKQFEEYRLAEGKENEQFIEEFVSGKMIRETIENHS